MQAAPRPSVATKAPPVALDQFVSKVTLQLITFFAFASAVAALILMPHPSNGPLSHWVVIPFSVMVSSAAAYALAMRGHARLGALIALVACYLALVWYVTYTGLGLRSYSLALLGVMVAASGTLIGQRAGIAATGIAIATIVALYFLETSGRVTDFAVVNSIASINVAVVYSIALAAIGTISLAFTNALAQSVAVTRLQEAQFRQLIETTPLGYVVHREGRVVLANRQAALGSGHADPQAMVGLDVNVLLPRTAVEITQDRIARAGRLPSGESLPPIEHDIPQPGGGTRRIEAVTMPVDLPDGPAVLTIVRDVTDERAATAALAEAKIAAELANSAKSEFLATMSHELRTPLNAVVGLAQMARQPGLEAGLRDDYLAKIGVSSNSLLELINDILDLSKIEAGALPIEHVAFDPRLEIARVIRIHASGAAARGLALSARVADEVPAALVGDPLRLRQVVGNFVSNAIKFTPSGRVDVHLSTAGPHRIRLEVRDTGIGIDEDVRERLFQPFSQADSSTTRRYGGTGLGLAVCRRIVERMGGHIGFESRPGAGSTFWIELPTPAAPGPVPSEAPPLAPSMRPDLREARVLLVEDNEVNQIVAVAALESIGVRPQAVSSGEEALAAFDGGARFDAVLMDLHMPGMDGFATTRAIRERYAAAELPVIALTAAAFEDDRARCEAAGMNDYVTKPFEFERLKAVLERWVRPDPARAVAADAAGAGVGRSPSGG